MPTDPPARPSTPAPPRPNAPTPAAASGAAAGGANPSQEKLEEAQAAIDALGSTVDFLGSIKNRAPAGKKEIEAAEKSYKAKGTGDPELAKLAGQLVTLLDNLYKSAKGDAVKHSLLAQKAIIPCANGQITFAQLKAVIGKSQGDVIGIDAVCKAFVERSKKFRPREVAWKALVGYCEGFTLQASATATKVAKL